MEELFLRGIIIQLKELITKMKELLVNHEHPNEKDVYVRKFFQPWFLMASNWAMDIVNIAIEKIYQIQSNKM